MEELFPLEGERLDTVNDGLRLLQKIKGQCFSTDALLLSAYLRKTKGRAAELGSGSGIVSLLALSYEKMECVDAWEIQHDYADLSARNAALNGLSHRLTVVEGDVREESRLPRRMGVYRAVFTNPPYMKVEGRFCEDDGRQIARHEVCGGVVDFCAAAGRMLCSGGCFYAVVRPDRLGDLFCAMREARMEPKRLTAVHPTPRHAPCLCLVEGKKDGKSGLCFTPPFFLKDETGADSEAYAYILREGSFPADYFLK